MIIGERDKAGALREEQCADGARPVSDDGAQAADAQPGKLAHDLRNFLAPIHNAVQVLKIRAQTDPSLQQLADMIERQVVGMRKRIDTMQPVAGAAPQAAPIAVPAANNPTASSARPARANAGMRLLIVDDNTAFRDSLGEVLRDQGHDTREAANGLEALEVARGWSPQLVFLDINMPGLNGYELARRFRAEYPASNMKLVMLSGDSLSEAATRAAQAAGFDHCMDKLSSVDAFRGLLEALANDPA